MREGEDFLPVAQHLLDPPSTVPGSASWRSSTGRAYYAAFGVASSILSAAGVHLSKGPGAPASTIESNRFLVVSCSRVGVSPLRQRAMIE